MFVSLLCRRPARAALALAAGTIFSAACAGTLPDEGGRGSNESSGAEGNGPASAQTARELYHAADALLMQACAMCHGGTMEDAFLEPPDADARYERIKLWPGFITRDASDSVLLTYPVKNGSHPGQNNQIHGGASIDDTPGLRGALEAWLEEEARLIVDGPDSAGGIETAPFTPGPLTVVYLGEAVPALDGAAIVFRTEEDEFGLTLEDMTVYAPPTIGLTIDRPRIIVYPLGAEAKAAKLNDALSDIELDVPAGGILPLEDAPVFLHEWSPGAKMAFHFQALAPYSAAGPVGEPCREIGVFEARARPALTACHACHANPGDEAVLAMDLVALANGSAVAEACAQILNRVVNLEEPANSLMFMNTDPERSTVHDFHFNGDVAQFSAFKAEMMIWIEAERAAAMAAGQ